MAQASMIDISSSSSDESVSVGVYHTERMRRKGLNWRATTDVQLEVPVEPTRERGVDKSAAPPIDLPPEPPADQKDIYAELRSEAGRNKIAAKLEQQRARRGECGAKLVEAGHARLEKKEQLGKCRLCEWDDSQMPERLADRQYVRKTLCYMCFLEDSSAASSEELKVRNRIVREMLKGTGIKTMSDYKDWVLKSSPDDELRRAKRHKTSES